jgi:metallo-beta-lactamase class B
MIRSVALLFGLMGGCGGAAASRAVDAPIVCSPCEAWNRPHEPFRIFGNTYYVGPAGLSSVLITSPAGHVLIDGGLPQSAAVIAANIEKLGFRVADIRVIANSHAHFDHAGGIAALQRQSGARVVASAKGAIALAAGQPTDDDPQAISGREPGVRFAPVAPVETVADGGTVQVGDVSLVARYTPGHTPGSTTWTWRSCDAGRCVDLVYADSVNPVSDDGFRYTDASRGGLAAAFRHSLEVIDHLPCDILVSVHPEFTKIDEKLAARAKGAASDPFIDPGACHAYAADGRRKLEKRLATEQVDAGQRSPNANSRP